MALLHVSCLITLAIKFVDHRTQAREVFKLDVLSTGIRQVICPDLYPMKTSIRIA